MHLLFGQSAAAGERVVVGHEETRTHLEFGAPIHLMVTLGQKFSFSVQTSPLHNQQTPHRSPQIWQHLLSCGLQRRVIFLDSRCANKARNYEHQRTENWQLEPSITQFLFISVKSQQKLCDSGWDQTNRKNPQAALSVFSLTVRIFWCKPTTNNLTETYYRQ